MSLLQVLFNGQPALRKVSEPIKKITPEIKSLANSMLETMRAYDGVGLSAVQVGVHLRLIVLYSPANEEYPDDPVFPLYYIVNPTLQILDKTPISMTEGCLSLPGWYGPVLRPRSVKVNGLDLKGKKMEIVADGFLGRVLQHEYDHLEGVLFTDKITDPALLRKIEMKPRPKPTGTIEELGFKPKL